MTDVTVSRPNEDSKLVPVLWKRSAFVLFLAVALVLPFVLDGYTTYQLALVFALAMAVLGVNLLTGTSGQFSIGHGAFFAVGAYTTSITMTHLGLSAYSAIALAAVVSFVSGFLFGWPALRLGIWHLMLMTWSLSMALPQVLRLDALQPWTGGVSGIYLDRPDPPLWTGLTDDQYWYFITLVVMVVFFLLAGNIINSRSGRALAAIRDNEIAAGPMGINVSLFKTTIFGISAMYAGIGGALTGLLADFVAPDSYSLFFSILLLIGAVLAGFRSVWGAIVGSFIVLFLPSITGAMPSALAVPHFGVILLLAVYFMPDGMSGLAQRAYRAYIRRRKTG
ncbi:MAG: branched-chain amino acid ABC transporter permease [Rhodospirillaceae bacterium]|jgi:branched-chain amino acid transport system permease protein|nr:branched-chain amino acid ABC transporter permease [Rhodospirillaceae bacterium]MBT4486106.1 branched-chain amino acid ABC transporter permease [Rhodospirillaceae bacterium]MBT5195569.1 branched-chain amino acid ABC transporter permease [Rhodospirillaceae bacterium]MBT6428648.1 branched-chain amino acid ABC transporter permease [Rhodospirillaceae bacterium]